MDEQPLPPSEPTVDVYLEIGKHRTFAGALDWPGWCRSGRDERSALQALCDHGPRYARVVALAPLGFQAPTQASAFAVVERLAGNSNTDFGAPDCTPTRDTRAVAAADLLRYETLLTAYWRAFDATVQAVAGQELRKGPRGGGRETAEIVRHVMNAERHYLARLGWKHKLAGADLGEELAETRQAVLAGLAAAVQGGQPERGPRGGVIWAPGYFVRRLGWHVLDHLWEIEDRASPTG